MVLLLVRTEKLIVKERDGLRFGCRSYLPVT